MTDDRTLWLIFGLAMLVLPLASLIARRPSIGDVLRALVGWIVIVGIVYVVIAQRDRIATAFAGLNERIGGAEQTVDGDTVRIRASADGHYWATVRLNGVERRMLIDSGATITAISDDTARAAGIEPRRSPPVLLNTANGAIRAERGVAETVRLGGLETRDLGVVISPTFGRFDVIGMNFLSRLDGWRVERGTLILEGSSKLNIGNSTFSNQTQ
ncbi:MULTISPECIES: TIGR02281 family clan AA aspartic protease [unclassified Sphingomonas]|uniref:retropepsin-like aspartic protease family protein n=1 Tax=unclassified Sphingomonas TaxID=196159 RepID=UPI000AFF6139|nr:MULTISPECIES: TIGR02281 family clan AA aspartic protease [unclassified Sphingomonas]